MHHSSKDGPPGLKAANWFNLNGPVVFGRAGDRGIPLETFTEPKELVANARYREQRRQILAALSNDMIDAPIAALIRDLNRLPCCFTLQACYGHFVYAGQSDPQNLAPLPPAGTVAEVAYRIAYIAFCIENNPGGRKLLARLGQIPSQDAGYIQFGCADWFWNRQVNSFALQVEPERFKDRDSVTLDYQEALHVEAVRNVFFARLNEVLRVSTLEREQWPC